MTATSGTWKFIVWERLNKSGKWCPYSAEVSQHLEANFKKDLDNVPLGDVEEVLKIYSVNLKDMVQVSEKTGTKSKVRRHMCSNIDTLSDGFKWEWNGNDKESWNSYDVDVNNFIEAAFQKGVKTVALKKTFRGYNYEIDFKKMLQINKQTKRKRHIRRKQDTSPYPVEQCLDNECESSVVEESDENSLPVDEYPSLAGEVPGTSALVSQLHNYLRSVTGNVVSVQAEGNSSVPNPPTRKKKKHSNNAEGTNDASLQENSPIKSDLPSNTTYAIVNGMPWHEPWPPHTPSSKLKPVPGIDPLPKVAKKTGKKKKKIINLVTSLFSANNDDIGVLDLYTEKVACDPSNVDLLNEVCIICYEALSKKSAYEEDSTIVKLKGCSHIFHKACLQAMYNSGPKDKFLQCPTCKKIHGEKCGIQPPGEMIYHVLPYSLPSFPDCDTIQIIYNIPSGTQGEEHPNPGKKYTARGFPRHCYLPDNEIGRKILRLLVKAWRRRLIFTVGRSSTTGENDVVTWNEIHHKTEFGCNRRGHGYPDPNYFDNILAELEAQGVKDDEVYLWCKA